MGIPFFFADRLGAEHGTLDLDEDQSRHIVQVLRMKAGDKLRLTNGKGYAALAEITESKKKHCAVNLLSIDFTERQIMPLTIAISPTKNTSRFEWFLEKAAELGIAAVVPLLCDRTEKQQVRHDRLENVCKSALLQSGQVWMTVIQPAMKFHELIEASSAEQRLFGHISSNARSLSLATQAKVASRLILVGPEGDFTSSEIAAASAAGFEGVSFGDTILRVETAGIYAAVLHAASSRVP